MAIYIDQLIMMESSNPQAHYVGERTGHRWCHLWSEDLEALHTLATRIGLKRAWFQDKQGFPHYDLTPSKRKLAIAAGAVEKTLREWIKERREVERREVERDQIQHDIKMTDDKYYAMDHRDRMAEKDVLENGINEP